MRVLRRGRVSVLIAVAIGLVAGGIAYASIPGPDGAIHGCYLKNGGQLRVIDSPAAQCTKGELPLDWNQQGAVGQTGSTGSTGATGATGPTGPSSGPSAYGQINGFIQPPTFKNSKNIVNVSHFNDIWCVFLDPSINLRNVVAVGNTSNEAYIVSMTPNGCSDPQGNSGIQVDIYDKDGILVPAAIFSIVVFP